MGIYYSPLANITLLATCNAKELLFDINEIDGAKVIASFIMEWYGM